MDKCSLDITVEFLGVAFHNILYHCQLYPASIFETRRKYGVVVNSSVHPEINKYLELCLKNIAELLSVGKLDKIDFVITNEANDILMKFVFNIGKPENFNCTEDAYLVRCEQNFRAFCLSLASVSDRLRDIPEDGSFSVRLHTDESGAVALASNPEFEEFPMIEGCERKENSSSIIPLRKFSFRGNEIETFIEL